MAAEPARVVVAEAAPAALSQPVAVPQPQRWVIDNAEETESQVEEWVMEEFHARVTEVDRVVVTIDPPQQQPTISAAKQALVEADPD